MVFWLPQDHAAGGAYAPQGHCRRSRSLAFPVRVGAYAPARALITAKTLQRHLPPVVAGSPSAIKRALNRVRFIHY